MGNSSLAIEQPIFITGCARSGTSLVAGIIDRCGAWGGNLNRPNRWNPHGPHENRMMRERIIKRVLREMKVDTLGQHPLPDIGKVRQLAAEGRGKRMREDYLQELIGQGYPGGAWYHKGAKLCLIWPVVQAAFPHARWVFVRRPTDRIVASCLRTPFMSRFRDEAGWYEWVMVHLQRLDEMTAAGLQVKELWSSKIIEGDLGQAMEVVAWLGLGWNATAVSKWIDPKVWERKK